MKRYLLFSFLVYESEGGWDDFKRDFDTVKEAEDYYRSRLEHPGMNTTYQIVDTKTLEVV